MIGYVDLKMNVNEFKDIIEKEANGDLTCGISNRSKPDQNFIIKQKSKVYNILAMMNKLEDSVLNWNCSHATKLLKYCKEDGILTFGNSSRKYIL